LPTTVLDQILRLWSQKWGPEEMISVFMPSVANDPETLRLLARQLRGACTPKAATAYFHYMLKFDARAVLASISAPTLVLHKRDFSFTSIAHGRYLAEHIRGAELRELPGRDSGLFSSAEGEEAFDAIAEFVTGTPRESEPDRVLATVLFCDMVNSTGEVATRGDRAWQSTLGDYFHRVRETVGRYGGREVTAIGDGVLVAFDRPSRAVRCAVSIRDSVLGMGLSVRCGVHTGECVLTDQQLSGIAVHIGARVAETAAPGEVWVSATVRELVAGSGLGFAERGAHELRGITGNYSLFAVT
jgi:class 3 adenylate cyclase